MKYPVAIALALAVSASPAISQDADEDGSMMQRGLELFFEGLRDEMSPTLRDLQDLAAEYGPAMRRFLAEMGPALADVIKEVEDWSRYEVPEILPNGDIIIRKKPDTPADPDDLADPDALPPAGPTDI